MSILVNFFMPYIDLTHTFTDSMPVYPGDPHPKLERVSDFEAEGFINHRLTTTMHVGTHMDAPLHMIENGAYVSEMELDRFFGRGTLVDASGVKSVVEENALGGAVAAGDIVVVYTGWSKYYRLADYFKDFPELSIGFAEKLVKLKISVLGLDTPSPDRAPFLVHKILLSAGIPIIENLTNLKQLVGRKFEITALPNKLRSDGAPCRVVARVNQ